jgi:cytochrome b
MPNLLPDWSVDLGDLGVFDVRAAGRMIWFTLILVYGIAIVVALIKPPLLKRPFPDIVGYALIPVIIVGGLVLGAIVDSLQRTIILAAIAALAAHTFMLVLSRKPRDPERNATWAECFAGAVVVFALFALAYAIVPHEWLEFANKQLGWGDNAKFVFESDDDILGLINIHYPFSMDFPALRDIVVTMIYGVLLVTNVKLWVMWQHRHEVKAVPESTETTPERRSRFGRPLRRTKPEATVPTSPAPESA